MDATKPLQDTLESIYNEYKKSDKILYLAQLGVKLKPNYTVKEVRDQIDTGELEAFEILQDSSKTQTVLVKKNDSQDEKTQVISSLDAKIPTTSKKYSSLLSQIINAIPQTERDKISLPVSLIEHLLNN